jgi:hypothetical protein
MVVDSLGLILEPVRAAVQRLRDASRTATGGEMVIR